MSNKHFTLPPLGTGTVTTGHGHNAVTTDFSAFLTLGTADAVVVDNEANVLITGVDANDSISEVGAGATILLGNGRDTVSDSGGSAIIVLGDGNDRVSIGGDGNLISLGNGNDTVLATGTGNTIQVGNGNNVIAVGAGWNASAVTTSDLVGLGSGANMVFLNGSGNTVTQGGGNDWIDANGANNTFVLAAGGSLVVDDFSLTNGDKLDLSQILAGTAVLPDMSNLASFVKLTTQGHGECANTVLTVSGSSGSEVVTLLGAGKLTLAALEANSLKLS